MPLFTKRKVADGQDALLIGKGKEKGDEYGTIDNDRSEKAKEKNEKNKSTSKPRSLRDLYRFSTPFDAILITFGVLGSIANGAGMPLMAIIFGGMSNTFIKIEKITQSGSADNFTLFSSTMPSLNSGLEEFNQNVITYSIYYVYMGLGILVVAYVQTACWMITCERQIHKIRKQFLKSILRQEIAWFDQKQTGELTAQLSGNLDRIKEGIGDKFGILVQYLTQMVTGYVIAFVYNWKLTLVMMALAPVMLGLGIAVWKVLSAISKREHTEYAAAGAIADQVLSCIKTVMAFNGQKQEHARYEKALEEAKKTGIKRGLFQGVSIGVIMLSIFGSYSLALWYGAKLIVWKELDPGTVFIVLMSVMSGSQSLGNISPQFAVLAAAKSGAASIFDIIDAKPTIDPYSTSGRKLEKPMGKIQFSNVKFAYPTRKEVTVLKDVSFSVDSGQCVAVVGSSGSGKSTIVSLLLRYYDVDAGRVSIDGENIKNLNLHWLRRLIAVVSQEPVLFDATIEENIRFGRMDVSRTEIIHAAQMANAHDFISSLPEAYRTRVGERGTQLSGGQKQRIAIARALVRRPKILLLDEATSALDAESESLVQEALDLARQGRTTIVIAHRLSTIRNADKIVAIKDGQLYETGTHDELMSKKGLYYDLVTAQTFDTIAPENIMVSEEDDVFLNGAENGPDASAAALVRRTSSTRRTASRSGYMSGSEPESGSARRLSRMLSRGVETEKERLEREAKEEQAEKSTVLAIMKENKPEWWAITLGLVGATIRGAGFPLFSLFYSQMFAVYTKEDDILLSESNFWALMMVAMGLVMALGDVISSSCFGISSENLTMRLRLKTFQNILRQDAAYFDNPAHVTGKLCTRLATDAAMIKGAVDQRMSTILTSVVSMVAGIVVGMLYSWELTLLMLLILPLFALGMYVRFKVRIRRGAENRDGLLLEAAGQTASEAIENIRTVQALTREIPVYETFCRYLQTPYKQALRHTQSHAISYAFSQCIIFFFYAACFRFGAYLVMQGKLGPMDIFKVFFVIMFSGMTVGWATAYFPEMMKARIAAGLIMKMINERPRIDNCSNAGLKSDYTGSVTFDAVYFLYPSRPNSHVLRGLSFQVSPGRTVALVGASGCGKSTIVNLIERFYDPTDGRILIDNQDLKTMNLQSSRDQMALVSQEPTLFDCSIYDNILYGTTGIEHERVIEAARLANIHEFVMGLPEGYATRVGEKGVQLSGGQKQRIAIARALVRNPKILLLDEATSALDTESEKLVQDALDKARRGRTCIMIAHRLSTIQNADRIFVLKNGRIVEEGSHMELVNARGPYYELTKRQHKPH